MPRCSESRCLRANRPSIPGARSPMESSTSSFRFTIAFSDAVEAGETARLLALLSSDARVTMPPQPLELIGHEAIGAFLDDRAEIRGAPLPLRPTRAHGPPASGHYLRSQPRRLMVLTPS